MLLNPSDDWSTQEAVTLARMALHHYRFTNCQLAAGDLIGEVWLTWTRCRQSAETRNIDDWTRYLRGSVALDLKRYILRHLAPDGRRIVSTRSYDELQITVAVDDAFANLSDSAVRVWGELCEMGLRSARKAAEMIPASVRDELMEAIGSHSRVHVGTESEREMELSGAYE